MRLRGVSPLAPASCRRRGPRGHARGCAGGVPTSGWGCDLAARAILVRRILDVPLDSGKFPGSRRSRYLARGSPFRHGLNPPPAATRSPTRSLTQLEAWIRYIAIDFQQGPVRVARRAPRHPGKGSAHQPSHHTRVEQNGQGPFAQTHQAGDNEDHRPAQGGEHRQKHHPQETGADRPDDNEHAEESDPDRSPAPHPDRFAEHRDREGSHEERRYVGERGTQLEGKLPEGGHEEQPGSQQKQTAKDMEEGPSGAQATAPARAPHQRNQNGEHHPISDPQDLRGAHARREVLCGTVGGDEAQCRAQHQAHREPSAVGAPVRLTGAPPREPEHAFTRICSGSRLSGLGRAMIAISGSHYLRPKFGFGSE